MIGTKGRWSRFACDGLPGSESRATGLHSARKVEYPELEIKQESKRSYPYDSSLCARPGLLWGRSVSSKQLKQEYQGARKNGILSGRRGSSAITPVPHGKMGYERKGREQ